MDFTDLADINAILRTFKKCVFNQFQIYLTTPPNIQNDICLKTTTQSLSEYVRLIQKLGLYGRMLEIDRIIFKKLKLPLQKDQGCILFDGNRYNKLSYDFFKDINPNIIKLIKITNSCYRDRNKNIIIPEENLRELPKGVMLQISIPYDLNNVATKNYYEELSNTLGAVTYIDYFQRIICFVKV